MVVGSHLKIDEAEIAGFRQMVFDYYQNHGRRLPWRETTDPYAILVSEIMLQQTQVDRVREKYREFLAVFPDLAGLAAADLSQVLAVWQGLGYNRRALALRLTARAAAERFGGELPRGIPELESLPGIGPYTARAVAVFAFGAAVPFIETNIRSVFIHHFFPGKEKVKDSEILPLVERTLDRESPRDWYYALMDLGSMLKRTLGNPGRQSAHHAVQSRFRGSNREQRSMILRAILAAPGITEAQLAQHISAESGSLARNLDQLEREGFIKKEDGRFAIP